MSGYPLFIPEFVLCTNSSLFWFKIENELREFRNYLLSDYCSENSHIISAYARDKRTIVSTWGAKTSWLSYHPF